MSNIDAQRVYYEKYLRASRGHKPLVSRARAARHIDECRAVGMTVPQIARASGVSEFTIWRVLREGPGGTMRQSTAARILAVTPQRNVSTVGLVRRVRALSALGWSVADIADAGGVGLETVKAWRRGDIPGDRPCPSRAGLLRAYDALSMCPPPRRTRYERSSASRAANEAARRGWVPPLAWDDDTIDDPATEPVGAGYVEQPLADQIRDMQDRGMTLREIARSRGVSVEAVSRALQRANQKRGAA